MAKAKNPDPLIEELIKALGDDFARLANQMEYIHPYITSAALPKGRQLRVDVLIDGPQEDRSGRGVNEGWKITTRQHASQILKTLLETIKQFYANHRDALPAGIQVKLRYHNFGVRRQKTRTYRH